MPALHSLFLLASICYFTPPAGWAAAQPKNLSPHVKIGFVSPKISVFRPSINLALEKVDLSLKDYLQAVKKIHLSQPHTQWRDLGAFKLAAGEGRLTEISSRSAYGDIKMLQAIYLSEQTAYILTAATLKKDYAAEQKDLLRSLQSMRLAPDLYAALSQENQKAQFQEFFHSLSGCPLEERSDAWKNQKWISLQTLVQQHGSELGSYWQFLALQEGHEQIYNAPKNNGDTLHEKTVDHIAHTDHSIHDAGNLAGDSDRR